MMAHRLAQIVRGFDLLGFRVSAHLVVWVLPAVCVDDGPQVDQLRLHWARHVPLLHLLIGAGKHKSRNSCACFTAQAGHANRGSAMTHLTHSNTWASSRQGERTVGGPRRGALTGS